MRRRGLLALLLVLIRGFAAAEEPSLPCVPRDFDFGSVVCVCNATYCDTLPPPALPAVGEALVFTSDIEGARFLRTQLSFSDSQNGTGGDVARFALESTAFQTVVGWGGAFTDAAARNILDLSPDAQDRLLSSYFSASGLEYNLGRVNMGGCDFSWRTYTYADAEGDVELSTFALQPEDTDYKIPVIKRAEALAGRPLKLFASPWTAPKWMKTNNDYVGYGQLRQDMYQPWADYFVRFLDEYAAQGINYWGLTTQNQPVDGYLPGFGFNCMGWTAEEQRKWVAENLGPTLLQHGYGDVKLMILDDQRYQLPEWAENVLNDPVAAQYVDGVAVHWYTDQYTEPERLTRTHDLFPDFFILGTEACEGSLPFAVAVALGKWERLESYARYIIVDMNHWVTGWVDWNLALDMQGGPNWAENFVDAPIIVNKEADEFYKNPMFYAMGHFSKFVKEGATKLGLTSEDPKKLDATAFRNPDGSTAVVILNRSIKTIETIVETEDRGSLRLNVGPRSLQTVIFV
ncbi:lysosomal acid glucosylceramidase-like [Penaeus chinensis]|uniref:lysosomal acid glucosylceramidase-like n=1 Tax=Penaeus chinensis TaxID=139456 RepID=UPI001FB809F7|nr:lysosomal acid glucosylceramidase-like [Penaeus chinensis]